MADVFQDRVDGIRKKLKDEKNVELDDSKCFIGFDAYKRLIESGVDIVILATPPYFRPEHFQACVEARKHVFMEKPVAVDPVGARAVMAASKQAEAAGLCVVTGTQRRHQWSYNNVLAQVSCRDDGRYRSHQCVLEPEQTLASVTTARMDRDGIYAPRLGELDLALR